MSLQMFGLARLGRDPEMRQANNGESVLGLSLAFNVRIKGEKATQWVDASMWGKRAEAVAEYLEKGGMVSVSLDDVHIEQFTKADGTPQSKLVGRVSQLDLAGGGGEKRAPPPPPPPPPRRAPPPKESSGFDDMDDDIPFILSLNEFDVLPSKVRRLSRTKFS